MGILICGLNGCGKTTFGRRLAETLGFRFIDAEELYFPRSDESDPYANARTRLEAEMLLAEEAAMHPDFVFAAVKGDYSEAVVSLYKYVVLIDVPKEIRMRRIRERSFGKFGARMLPGGDLYAQEEEFFRMAESRREDYVEKWLQGMQCPVIRIDGTKSIEENIEFITAQMKISVSK